MEALTLDRLNQNLASSLVDARLAHVLNKYGDKALVTTSFGTTSALLLHIVARVKPDLPVHFVDTGFLFPETHAYKEELTRILGLNIITHKAPYELNQKSRQQMLWKVNPDLCCSYNKITPIESLLSNYDIWISGLLGYQNSFRTGLNILQQRKDLYRFYPLIDWTEKQVKDYYEYFGLPRHPLEALGFSSLGCTHCTAQGKGREGRWSGLDKTECGLHT
ncbi:MAG: phosphoadenylyl-sulfate reductase [Balneola sp.]|nr:MAG: phosphoadenylyl-sulfate reductase [Balneola sp.]